MYYYSFIRSDVVAGSPGSQFDCAVTEYHPINLTCHQGIIYCLHCLPDGGCGGGGGGAGSGLPYAMLVKSFYSP